MKAIRGKVHTLGHDIDTDALAPFDTLTGADWENVRARMLARHRHVVEALQPGDVIVAGRNFGCGSSREQAVENLLRLQVGVVVAESIARIFYRNCVATALPVLRCEGILEAFDDGDEIRVELATGRVDNLTRGRVLHGQAHGAQTLEVIERGGLMKVLAERLRSAAP